MKKILYIPVETKVRELPSKLLLSYFAIKRGFSIVIGRKHFVKHLVHSGASGVYIIKSGYRDLEHLNKNGVAVILNDAEGIVFDDKTKFVSRAKPFDKINCILVAGSFQRDIFNSELNEEVIPKIKVIGEPRFDTLNKDFVESYAKFVNLEHIREKIPFILLPSIFVLSNPSPIYDKKNFKLKFSSELLLSQSIVFNEYLKLIDVLSARFPKLNFIIRPHPSENSNNYKKQFRNHPNVYINQDESSLYWIYYSELVVFHQSTTGLEAILLKKNAINFLPGEDHSGDLVITKKLGKIAKSINQVIEYISEMFEEHGNLLNFDEQLKQIENYVSIQNDLSVIRMLDIICDEFDNDFGDNQSELISNYSIPLKLRLTMFILKILFRIDTKFDKFFSILPFYKLSSKSQKFPELSAAEISKYFMVFDKLYGEKSSLQPMINLIAPDTFFLSNNE